MKGLQRSGNKSYTISIGKANLYSILIILPIGILYISSYGLLWNWEATDEVFFLIYDRTLICVLVLAAGVVLHELLHAAVWALAGKTGYRSFKFGFNVRGLSPYAHCRVPMKVQAYRWGTLAPGLLLGILPFCLALVTGNSFLMFFGFIFTLVAGGDFLMLWLMRDIPPDTLVQDHPEQVGCLAVTNT